MLMPKRVKWRKQMRGRMRGKALRGAEVSFGEYGLQALEPGWVTARHTLPGTAGEAEVRLRFAFFGGPFFVGGDGLGIDDGLFVDRVGRRRLGRVTFDAIGVAALGQLDQLDRGGRDVQPDERAIPRSQRKMRQLEHGFSFSGQAFAMPIAARGQLRRPTI